MPQATTAAPILAALRQGTSQAHRELEGSIPLGRADLTLTVYIRTLRIFHAFVSEWERVGAQQCPPAFAGFFDARRRVALLEHDLRFFAAAPLSSRPDLSAIRGPAAFWGAMYVMEGSTLGGQVISRRLEADLGLCNRNGYSYFYGHGPETGQMWRSFTEVLREESASLSESEIVAAAARQFEIFRSFFADSTA